MSREAKLLERLLDPQRDKNWSFDELCGLLTRMGFEMRMSGSHHFFRRAGLPAVLNLQPRGASAKPYQVRQVREVLTEHKLI